MCVKKILKEWYTKLPKISGYAKFFDKTKQMIFLTKDGKLLEAHNNPWESVDYIIKKMDIEPVYN